MNRQLRKLTLAFITVCAATLAWGTAGAGAAVTPNYQVVHFVHAGFLTHADVFDSDVHALYVAGEDGSRNEHPQHNAVTVLDTVSRSVSATIHLSGAPNRLAHDPAHHAVYATVEPTTSAQQRPPADGYLDVIDDRTNTVSATITVGRGPDGVAVDSGLSQIYVGNTVDDTVSVVNSDFDVTTITTSASPTALAVDPLTHRVFVAESSGQLQVIDGTTDSVVGTVPLPGIPQAVAVDPGLGDVYAAIDANTHGRLAVVDEATSSVVKTISFDGARNVFTVAVNTAIHKVYVTTFRFVRVVDGPSMTYNARVHIKRSFGVDVDPATDTVYATHLGLGVAAGGGVFILRRTPH